MSVLYAALAGPSTTSDLYTLDPVTGIATSVGPIGFAVTGLAWDATTSTMYGATSNNSSASPHSLITINLSTGAGTLVGGFTGTNPLGDITCDSAGNLYGFQVTGTRGLYSINKTTGATTRIGTHTYSSGFGGAVAEDGNDVIWAMFLGDNSELDTIDHTTGNPTTVVAVMTGSPQPSGGMGAATIDASGVLWAIDGGSGFTHSYLVTVDTGTGVLTEIGETTPYIDALAWNVAPGVPPVTIHPTGIVSGEAFGTPTLTAPSTQTLLPTGFGASGAMGTPTVADVGTYTIYPTGIP